MHIVEMQNVVWLKERMYSAIDKYCFVPTNEDTST